MGEEYQTGFIWKFRVGAGLCYDRLLSFHNEWEVKSLIIFINLIRSEETVARIVWRPVLTRFYFAYLCWALEVALRRQDVYV